MLKKLASEFGWFVAVVLTTCAAAFFLGAGLAMVSR